MTALARPLELASSGAAVWWRKPIKWGDVALFLLFCLFTFIWMMPALYRVQFSTLKVGSNIHFHAKVESTVGMMNGRSIEARTIRLKRK